MRYKLQIYGYDPTTRIKTEYKPKVAHVVKAPVNYNILACSHTITVYFSFKVTCMARRLEKG